MNSKVSRRSFLGTTAAAAAFTVIPSNAMGSALGHKSPSDKLNIAVVGPGGRGRAMVNSAKATENIVAMADVDLRYANRVFEENPGARKYQDYRKMYEEMRNSIDAVIVAGSDHTHAIQAANAMVMGKHVYVEKPLTHSVYESRLLTKLAEKHQLATTMGNQGSSAVGVRQVCDWIAAGLIGTIKKVDTFTDRPIWPQGLNPPKQGMWVPETLDWDLFCGPAKLVPYHEIYHPWNHRGWWEFGTGALGDMACHVMHPIFKALQLGYPTKVQGSSTQLLADCAPTAQHVKYTFPARRATAQGYTWHRDATDRGTLPEVEINWYDGGLRPVMPDHWPAGKNMNDSGGAAIFYGTKGILVCGCYGVRPWMMDNNGRVFEAPANVPKTQREVPVVTAPNADRDTTIHVMDWVRACKESPTSRTQTASAFHEAGPFNEMVVMGVLAVRLQGLNKILNWDGANMQFTNIADNDEITYIKSDNFTIVDGHPSFGADRIRLNAKAAAAEMIKHTYRTGWSLPAMPA
jgi:predicted dehydrogenase